MFLQVLLISTLFIVPSAAQATACPPSSFNNGDSVGCICDTVCESAAGGMGMTFNAMNVVAVAGSNGVQCRTDDDGATFTTFNGFCPGGTVTGFCDPSGTCPSVATTATATTPTVTTTPAIVTTTAPITTSTAPSGPVCEQSSDPCASPTAYSIGVINGAETETSTFCFDFGGSVVGHVEGDACSLDLSTNSADFGVANEAIFSVDYPACRFEFDGDELVSFTLGGGGGRKRQTSPFVTFDACEEFQFDDGTGLRKRAPIFSGSAASSSGTFGVLASGANGDPHLIGAHGEHYDFFGMPGAVYTLFSTPQFVLNMQLWDKGPEDRYIERLALVFRNVTHVFSTAAYHPIKFEQKLNRELAPVGGKAKLRPFHIELELCEGHVIEIVHRVAKAQKNAGDIYHLDVAVTVPGCHDSYGGALGQTYQCRYAKGERFVWSQSHKLEETFRVKSLSAKSGAFARDAPCHDIAKVFAGQSPVSGRSGKPQE